MDLRGNVGELFGRKNRPGRPMALEMLHVAKAVCQSEFLFSDHSEFDSPYLMRFGRLRTIVPLALQVSGFNSVRLPFSG